VRVQKPALPTAQGPVSALQAAGEALFLVSGKTSFIAGKNSRTKGMAKPRIPRD